MTEWMWEPDRGLELVPLRSKGLAVLLLIFPRFENA